MDIVHRKEQFKAVVQGFDFAMQKGAFGLNDDSVFRPAYLYCFDLHHFLDAELPVYVAGMEKTVADQEARIKQLEEENELYRRHADARDQDAAYKNKLATEPDPVEAIENMEEEAKQEPIRVEHLKSATMLPHIPPVGKKKRKK